MGRIHIDGVQIGDDGRDAFGRTDLPPIPARERPISTMDVLAAHKFGVTAPGIVAATIKACARNYRRHPARLDIIFPDLSQKTASQMIAIAEMLEGRASSGLPGFGGDVPAMNAKGVKLLGRWRRRFEAREGERAAA